MNLNYLSRIFILFLEIVSLSNFSGTARFALPIDIAGHGGVDAESKCVMRFVNVELWL